MRIEIALASTTIKVTAQAKNLSEQFYEGIDWSSDPKMKAGFNNWPDIEKLKYVLSKKNDSIKVKVGNGQFREAVELNSKLKGDCSIEYTTSPRRGYTLMTFLVS